MNSKINLEKAREMFYASTKKYKEERPSIIFLDKPPKQEVVVQMVKTCAAINLDGKRCKIKVNPEFKCFCTRHGKKT